eukprot:scaffold33767_cov155-Skeletonema_dohrnii-CCMP3373.AAC.2
MPCRIVGEQRKSHRQSLHTSKYFPGSYALSSQERHSPRVAVGLGNHSLPGGVWWRNTKQQYITQQPTTNISSTIGQSLTRAIIAIASFPNSFSFRRSTPSFHFIRASCLMRKVSSPPPTNPTPKSTSPPTTLA